MKTDYFALATQEAAKVSESLEAWAQKVTDEMVRDLPEWTIASFDSLNCWELDEWT